MRIGKQSIRSNIEDRPLSIRGGCGRSRVAELMGFFDRLRLDRFCPNQFSVAAIIRPALQLPIRPRGQKDPGSPDTRRRVARRNFTRPQRVSFSKGDWRMRVRSNSLPGRPSELRPKRLAETRRGKKKYHQK